MSACPIVYVPLCSRTLTRRRRRRRAADLNYICTNWTRPTPLPCKPAVDSWQPRWGKRFMVFSWWPPLPSDYEAYADAGFNLALLRGDTWVNRAQEAAYAESEAAGKAWRSTHDGLFSPKRCSHSDVPRYNSLLIIYTKYTGVRQDDCHVYA